MTVTEATKMKARMAVRRALASGVLTRPTACEDCGEVPSPSKDGRALIQAHHHLGYDHPTDVRWLCPRCHFSYDKRPSGEKQGRAKITAEDAAEIRTLYKPGASGGRGRPGPKTSAKALGRRFGLSQRTVKRIATGQIWADAALSPSGEK